MAAHLILSHVSKRAGSHWRLKDVSISFAPGKVTALIGANGAGKTTLLHVIAGTLKPECGTVELEGRDITGLQDHVIARIGVGRFFQDVRLFDKLTAIENVMVAALPPGTHRSWLTGRDRWFSSTRLEQAKLEAGRWLNYVGLPGDHDTLADELSVGQQKLVGLARLLARVPSVMLLDEPTAGLSPPMVERIVSVIERAVAEVGLTVVLVDHNLKVVARLASWIHVLSVGRIVLSGAPADVLADKRVREMYVGI